MYRFLSLISKSIIYPDLDPIRSLSTSQYTRDTCFSPLLDLIHKLAILVNICDIITFSNGKIAMLEVGRRVNSPIGNLKCRADYQTSREADFKCFPLCLLFSCLWSIDLLDIGF